MDGKDDGTSAGQGPRLVLVMGVSGCGKSTVARLLAAQIGYAFVEGDAFHPAANVAKMSRGEPLNDEDRRPWLDALRAHAAACGGPGVVLACSALKASYRARLGVEPGAVVYLKGDRATLAERMRGREHFMPVSLLDSQLATLEEPAGAITLPITLPPERLCALAREGLGL